MTLEQLTKSPVVQMIGYIVGILGVCLAVIFYIKQKIRKELSYFRRQFQLVGSRLKTVSKIQVLYDKSPVEKLNISELTVFNSGNAVLLSDDVPPKCPLYIVPSDDGTILEVVIAAVSNRANNCRIEYSGHIPQFEFDFLRPLQGCKIKVIHTAEVVFLVGTLKDSEIRSLPYFTVPNLKETQRNLYLNAVLFMVSVGLSIARIYFAVAFAVIIGISTINNFRDWSKAKKLKKHELVFRESDS